MKRREALCYLLHRLPLCIHFICYRNLNRNRNLKIYEALLKSQAHQGTSLFKSAAKNQRGFSNGGRSREDQVRFPEYQEGDRVAVKVSDVQMEKMNDQICLSAPGP